jgi:hypothetical protein
METELFAVDVALLPIATASVADAVALRPIEIEPWPLAVALLPTATADVLDADAFSPQAVAVAMPLSLPPFALAPASQTAALAPRGATSIPAEPIARTPTAKAQLERSAEPRVRTDFVAPPV